MKIGTCQFLTFTPSILYIKRKFSQCPAQRCLSFSNLYAYIFCCKNFFCPVYPPRTKFDFRYKLYTTVSFLNPVYIFQVQFYVKYNCSYFLPPVHKSRVLSGVGAVRGGGEVSIK